MVILLKVQGAFASGSQCPGIVALISLSAVGDVMKEGGGLGEGEDMIGGLSYFRASLHTSR